MTSSNRCGEPAAAGPVDAVVNAGGRAGGAPQALSKGLVERREAAFQAECGRAVGGPKGRPRAVHTERQPRQGPQARAAAPSPITAA